MDAQARRAFIAQLTEDPMFRQVIAGAVQPAVQQLQAYSFDDEDFAGDAVPSDAISILPAEAGSAQALCISPVIMPGGGTVVNFHGMIPPPNAIGYNVVGAGANGSLNLFPYTFEGERGYAFCLNRGLPAPNAPVGNVSAEQAMPGMPESIRRAVAFVIANVPAPPSGDPEGVARFWTMLGRDCGRGWDAYAIAQMVIWTLMGGSVRNEFHFTAANNDCLMAAYNDLLDMAVDYGTGNLQCAGGSGEGFFGGTIGGMGVVGMRPGDENASCCSSSCGSSGGGGCASSCCGESGSSCCGSCGGACGSSGSCSSSVGRRNCSSMVPWGCQIGRITCCNTNRLPTAPGEAFLIFVGCPNDIREHCGRVLVGPFRLAASNMATPEITLQPCNGCPNVVFDVVDHCGCPIEPNVGDEFYISFRPPCCCFCFELCAEIDLSMAAVYFFRVPGGNFQNMGVPLRRDIRRRTCIQVCIDLTPPPVPPPMLPPPGEPPITINNNNNNDTNANVNPNLNSNSTVQTLMETLLLSSLLGNPQPQVVPQPVPVPVPVPQPVPVEHPVFVPYPVEPCMMPPPCPPPCNGPPPCPPSCCFAPPPLPFPPMPCLPPCGPPCDMFVQPPHMPCYQTMPLPCCCEPMYVPVPVPVPEPVPYPDPFPVPVAEPVFVLPPREVFFPPPQDEPDMPDFARMLGGW